ncbi:type I restriction-modification system subunit M [candidate division TA06 bacterium]|nr:type I restriction-modification system subunit M [candidate division TA06 bacterium]
MAIKKSELYSSLWASCDELRGGMDASQYKDYVLVILFVKYISDRYSGQQYSPIKVPRGASFQDMVALKGNPNIGDLINKKIIGPIAEANKLSEMPDFANPDKLGSGADMVKKLTNLIAIFENPALDFKTNRAQGDDILGDAYEYLMRHFATESGKSKGQFYTPAEVSRVMAKIIGISPKNSTAQTTVYDPTCGSGSLLLKVADESEKKISIFGQENETATAGLARMNMILHDNPTGDIRQGNTLSSPLFKDDNSRLKTFDYVVANPPFSFKSWSNGVNLAEEQSEGGRFYGFGQPPAKNGDYAFLLHIVKSLKSRGKGTVILPHGVLFRGNAEAEIRKNLIRRGLIKGIIGLPANLFYGTGIPACLIVLDKEGADHRKGIFMIDASKGFEKDGNKNRLREQDIHKIVDVFNRQLEIPKYSQMVSVAEIEEKEFNLNIPRYIDSTEPEDIQDIDAHLRGGIPKSDIEALKDYWAVCPTLRRRLFAPDKRAGYVRLKIEPDKIKQVIYSHPEFEKYSAKVNRVFAKWKESNIPLCKRIGDKTRPKQFIHALSEDLLEAFSNLQLIDKYDVYQHLMTYWMETMQDDCYLIVAEGWAAGNEVEWTRRDFEGRLIPKQLMIARYFAVEQKAIEKLEAEYEGLRAQIEEMEEENSGDDGCFFEWDKVNKASVQKRLKDIEDDKDATDEKKVLLAYLKLAEQQAEIGRNIREAMADLEKKLLKKYKALSEAEMKVLVVEDKWMASIGHTVETEMQRISQRLTQRINELIERYSAPLPELTAETQHFDKKVCAHLSKMGFSCRK